MTREQKCAAALANRGKPKRTMDRMTEAEKDALASIWDEHGAELGGDFVTAYAEFWLTHSKRWAEVLEVNKATVADPEIDEPTESDE